MSIYVLYYQRYADVTFISYSNKEGELDAFLENVLSIHKLMTKYESALNKVKMFNIKDTKEWKELEKKISKCNRKISDYGTVIKMGYDVDNMKVKCRECQKEIEQYKEEQNQLKLKKLIELNIDNVNQPDLSMYTPKEINFYNSNKYGIENFFVSSDIEGF